MIIMQINCEIEEHGSSVFLPSEFSDSVKEPKLYTIQWGKLLEETSLDLSVRNATQFGMKFFRDCIKDVNINKYFLQVFPRF